MLVVLIGYLSGKFKLLSEDSSVAFARFAFFIAMPCQLFVSFSNTPINQAININYTAAYAIGVCITAGYIFFYSRQISHHSLAESALNIMGASQANTAYYALPLFILVFNNPTPVIPILIFQVMIVTTIVLLMIEHDLKNSIQQRRYIPLNAIKILLKNPIIIGSILGMLVSYFKIQTPTPIHKCLDLLAATAAPLALFALGQSLYLNLRKISKRDLPELSIITTIKLVILPTIAFIVGNYVFHLERFWLASVVIMSAMPAPKNMFIFAIRYNLDTRKSSAVVAITTLISFVTVNLLMIIFQSYILEQ